jgi:hypothetical protein
VVIELVMYGGRYVLVCGLFCHPLAGPQSLGVPEPTSLFGGLNVLLFVATKFSFNQQFLHEHTLEACSAPWLKRRGQRFDIFSAKPGLAVQMPEHTIAPYLLRCYVFQPSGRLTGFNLFMFAERSWDELWRSGVERRVYP